MAKKIVYEVDMDWKGQQARLDHYNKWLMDPKRPLSTVYPGFPGENKTDSCLEQETVQDAPVSTVKKSKGIKRLAKRNVTVALKQEVSHNDNTESMKGKMMTKVTNLSRAIEIVRATPVKAEALDKIVAVLGVKRPNAFVYFTKAVKALGVTVEKAPKAEKTEKAGKPAKVRTSKVTELSTAKHTAKVAEIDAVIAGLKAAGATVASPFAGLGQ